MKRVLAAMLAVSLAIPAPLVAAPKRDKALENALRAHVIELASDAYQGREPGTDGEAKTLRYLAKHWFEIGLVSGTNNPRHAWFAPVTLVAREPSRGGGQFFRKGKRLVLPPEALLTLTSGKRALVENAPVLFVGRGDLVPARAELAGRVALLLDNGKDDTERQNALLKGGASAVLTVLDGERTLDNVMGRRQRLGYALASDQLGGDLEAFITRDGLDQLLAGTGQTTGNLTEQALKSDFAPKLTDLTATLEATTRETRINTHNLIGKLPGKRPEAGAILLVAHWDAFGVCAEAPAEDLICNGAVDNASGVAALTEIARRLAKLPQLDRDVYFLATTAEEIGLLGAHAFAENPPLPLNTIVAAFNLDSVALSPRGTPLAVVGRGMTPLDAIIAKVAKAEKFKLVEGDAANAYVRRQDGWALLQHDVPTVMVSNAYADIPRLERFFDGDYHRPGDQLKPEIDFGGAAEDVLFHVALVRWLADLKKVPVAPK
jgi:hypothetical protein